MKLMSSNSHLDTLKIIIDIKHLQHFETGITPKKLAKYNTHYHAGHVNDPLFTAWSKLKQNIDTEKKPIEAKVQPKTRRSSISACWFDAKKTKRYTVDATRETGKSCPNQLCDSLCAHV